MNNCTVSPPCKVKGVVKLKAIGAAVVKFGVVVEVDPTVTPLTRTSAMITRGVELNPVATLMLRSAVISALYGVKRSNRRT